MHGIAIGLLPSRKVIPTFFSGSPQNLLKYLAFSLFRQPSESPIIIIKETHKRIQMSKLLKHNT